MTLNIRNRLQVVLPWLSFATLFGRCKAKDPSTILILSVTAVLGVGLICLCVIVLIAIIYLRYKTKIIDTTSASLPNLRYTGNNVRRPNNPRIQPNDQQSCNIDCELQSSYDSVQASASINSQRQLPTTTTGNGDSLSVPSAAQAPVRTSP